MIKRTTYQTGIIIQYEEGDKSLERVKFNHQEDINDRAYTIKDEDTLTDISFRFYGEPGYWYIIADVNDISNPFNLTTGLDIIIPNLDKYEI